MPIHATDWQSDSTVAVGHRLWQRRVARWWRGVWARPDPVTGALAGATVKTQESEEWLLGAAVSSVVCGRPA